MLNAQNHPPADDAARVFVVDDDPLVLKWIQDLLTTVDQPFESFQSPTAFLARIGPERQGCVVLDIRMPELNGLEVQDALIQRGIRLPIIFLSAHGDIPMALGAVRKGAFDFIEKPARPSVVLERIDAALRLDRRQREERAELESGRGLLSQLSDRELDVLRMVLAGLTNKAIASELHISQKTVEYRRNRLMDKLGVDSMAQLIQLSLQLGIQPQGKP